MTAIFDCSRGCRPAIRFPAALINCIVILNWNAGAGDAVLPSLAFVVPLLARTGRARAILLSGCLLMMAARTIVTPIDGYVAYYAPIMHASGLLSGALICFCGPPKRLAGFAGMALTGAALVFPEHSQATDYGVALGAPLLIADIAARPSLHGRILSVTPLVALGRISYGIYLWHSPIVMLLDSFPRRR